MMPDKDSTAALSGRWLAVARTAWLFVLVAGLALVVLNLRETFYQYQTVCPGTACANVQPQI